MGHARTGRLALLQALLLLVPGCAARRGPVLALPPCAEGADPRDAEEALAACLARGDAHYAARLDPARLDAALATYQEATSFAPADPVLLGRLARAYAAKGYGYPESGREAHRIAREEGLRCLATAPDVAGAIAAAGGVLTVRAVQTADAELADCLLWTAMAWARGRQEGALAGAGMDQSVLVALGERARALAPELEDGLPAAALGLALALPPTPLQPDLDRAEQLLEEATRARPGRLSPQVDLATLVYARRGDAARWRETLERVASKEIQPEDPDALENRRAVLRARAALAEGAPDPDAWWRHSP